MNHQEENLNEFREFYDELGYSQAQLKWSPNPHSLLISGTSDLTSLSKLKNVILSLRQDWSSQRLGGIEVQGKSDIEKRLLLAENQIEGLLKRKINYSVKDSNGGERVLDYTNLLNEKQNQVVQLQKKIQNLQEKLRRHAARQIQLQNHVVKLTEQLKRKEQIISLKHNSAVAEVAISTAFRDALARVRRNVELNRFKLGEGERFIFEGVVLPEVGNFDIKSDTFSEGILYSRSRVLQQQTETQRYKTRLVQFFRQFERLCNQSQGITDFEVERILEGFLNNIPETKLYEKMQFSIEKYHRMQDYQRIKQNFAIAAGLFNDFVTVLGRDNVSFKLPKEAENIFELLSRDKVTAVQVQSGAIFVDLDVTSTSTRTVEVPVQDARTKHLIHLLAHELKRLFLKFPKLQGQIDGKLAEFLQQEVIDVIDADEVEKLIQIVKYVPQIIKVQNVYTHSHEKERKIEFHLRILIKTLLEELEKIRLKTGVIMEIDEGVIGMIKAEIMDVVNVDDILKVFRVTPKIVEVQKIVQKIVERLVEVPKVITVEKIVEKIVEVQRIKQVQRFINVPIETPFIVETQVQRLIPVEHKTETIVEVPTIVQKLVELKRQVPKVVEIQVIREKIVQVDRPIEVQKIVNHIQTQYQQIEVIQEKLVPVEKIVEKIVEVPVYVEKIVERVVEVPKLIQVEKIVEKIVERVEYRNAREVENHIEIKYQVVDRVIEKIVPIIQYRQRIKEVPQQIQVIKQVNNVITEIKEVEVIRQKIVYQQRIKEVVRVETVLVQVIKQVIKQVEHIVQIPIIREVAVIKELIIEKPVISRIQSVHIKEVMVREPLIVKEPVIVQVQKYVNVYVEVPKTIKYIEEKIVEVPTTIDRIKEVRVIVQKIIQKMVEVPKVVQVQKIVERIVVVPRVIEKVIQVPQIIQKVVQKQVIREVIRQIEKIVHVPVIQEVIKQVEVIKNIYIEIEKPVDRIIQKAVEVPRIQEKIITKQIIREVPITLIQEVPRQIEVQKIVTQTIEAVKAIEVERQIIVPYEIPVPVETIVQKIVPREEIFQRIISVPQIIQKIVTVREEVVRVEEVERIVQKILIQKSIEQVEKIVPYIQQVIREVPTIVERLVPIETRVQQIVTAQQIIEKVIQKTITIPQIYQVERIRQKLVEVPKLVEIERCVPQIIRMNQYIQRIVEKIVQVPIIIESMKEVVREQQRIVQVKSQSTEIVEVERTVEKLVYAQKLKQVVRNVNYIEKVLQIIDRIEQIPVSIITTEEKFIEVPYILQKIVQKIIIMPQIVEVLKYVHEVCEVEDHGVAVDVQMGVHEARYRELTKNIEVHLDQVLKELRYLKVDNVTRTRIQIIQKFMEELRKFILVPRIVKVTEQKIVEKEVPVDRIVQMQGDDERSIKMELSLSILAEKLISQLKRIKQKTGINLEIDDDIKLIFFNELKSSANLDSDMLKKLQSYSAYVQRQFEALGHWTADHQLMLNSFLQQRFLMAELIQNANFEIEQAKSVSQQRMEGLKRYRGQSTAFANYLNKITNILNDNRPVSDIINIVGQYQKFKKLSQQNEPTYLLPDAIIDNERIQSLLRQKDSQITLLKDHLFKSQQKTQLQSSTQQDGVIKLLKTQNQTLKKQNSVLLTKTSESGLLDSYRQQILDLQARNSQLQQQISNQKANNYNYENQIKLMMQNVSFKRQPDSSFQQIQISNRNARQANLDGSRYSQSSSQGQSLSNSQAQLISDPQQYNSTIIYPNQPIAESRMQRTGLDQLRQSDSRVNQSNQGQSALSQSGARAAQSSQQMSYDSSNLGQSGAYGSRQNQYPMYQGAQGQSGIRSFGVEDSQSIRGAQSGVTPSGQLGLNANKSIAGNQLSQSQSDINAGQIQTGKFTSQGGFSSALQGQGQSNIYVSGQSGVQASGKSGQQQQTGIYGQSQSGVYVPGQSGYYGRQPLESLYASRQQVSKSYVSPATQPNIEGQSTILQSGNSQIGGNISQGQQIPVVSGFPDPRLRTPIENYKFNSPSPTGIKLTQSILKQQQSLSKLQAQSPQSFKKQETSREGSGYKYYFGQQKKE